MGAAIFVYFWNILDHCRRRAISIFGLKKVANFQKTAFGDFQGHPGFQTLICARVGGRGNEKMLIENVFSQGGPFSRLVYDENQVINIDWLFNFHFYLIFHRKFILFDSLIKL